MAESDLPGPITNTATVTGMTPISTVVGPVTATHTVSATGYPNLTLSSAPNPSAFGQNVTFTATVVAAAPVGKTPTGVVTFTVEGTPVTATLSSGMATYSTPGLSAGEHPVWFAYGGDQSFLPNTSEPLTQTVNQAATATALESAPDPTVYGEAVTFTATVTVTAPGAGIPTGVVTFTTATGTLGAGAVGAGGVATLTTTSLPVGSSLITATYGGDGNFQGASSAPVTQAVGQAGTATTLVRAPAATVYGEPVTLTATVTITAPGAGLLTGVVTFTTATGSLGAGVVGAGGVATLTTTSLPVGSPLITATYGGDASFQGSNSSPVTQTVSKAGTATALVNAPNATVFGQPVTFTATVTVSAPGGRVAGGRGDLHHSHGHAGRRRSGRGRRGDLDHHEPARGQLAHHGDLWR